MDFPIKKTTDSLENTTKPIFPVVWEPWLAVEGIPAPGPR